jgi:hypothetical protein
MNSVKQLKYVIAEAVSTAQTQRALTDGFAKHIESTIYKCVDELVTALANIASDFEDDKQYGSYINEFSFRYNDKLKHDLVNKLKKIVNDIADEAIEDVMRDYENAASNGDSFSTSTFNQVRKDRAAYNAAAKARK